MLDQGLRNLVSSIFYKEKEDIIAIDCTEMKLIVPFLLKLKILISLYFC